MKKGHSRNYHLLLKAFSLLDILTITLMLSNCYLMILLTIFIAFSEEILRIQVGYFYWDDFLGIKVALIVQEVAQLLSLDLEIDDLAVSRVNYQAIIDCCRPYILRDMDYQVRSVYP